MSKNLIPSYPLRVAPELKAEMTAYAAERRISLNTAIANAMRFYLDSLATKKTNF